MPRQNKNAKRRALARQFTELHKKGQKGPKSTTAKHGKRNRLTDEIFSRPSRREKSVELKAAA